MATQAELVELEEPTADERTMAMLAHLLMAFTGFIGPVVILCARKDSRFVKFHSLQALVGHTIYMVFIFVFVAVCIAGIALFLVQHPLQPHGPGQPPPAFVFLFPLVWLGFMCGWVVNLILGVVYAVKANRGEWATYPIFGKWLLTDRIAIP